jgi:hypothetical protein
MAYRMQDLGNMLPAQLKTSYSRQELIRFGYRSPADQMVDIAVGADRMDVESAANNQMFLRQSARAQRWIDYYYADRCGSGSICV